MRFIVKSARDANPSLKRYPYVILTRDNWDDFGYKTTFYAELFLTSSKSQELGVVKIVNVTQTSGQTRLPETSFTHLSSKHASLGGDLDYYEALYKLGPEIYIPYLEGMRDIAFDDGAKATVEDIEAYRVSLLRFSGAKQTIDDASRLFHVKSVTRKSLSAKRKNAGFRIEFKTRVSPKTKPFTVDFDFRRDSDLPHRINALIGYNGTGKTCLLSNLAIVASGYGYRSKKDVLQETIGRFVRTAPPFRTVIVVSYSPFDTFVIPGRTKAERDKLQSQGDIFGYVYCGLRERSKKSTSSDNQAYRLRTPAEIEEEFLESLTRVREAGREGTFLEVLKPLLRDPSFQRIGLTQVYAKQDNDEVRRLFRGLSSGHKIVLKIITELTAHIAESEPTLVLIDEPETHLHPPLLAALLKSARVCLEAFDGYAIVATHSPVVLQETPAKYVRVLRRAPDESGVVATAIETFAENIGVITQEVFNLGDGSSDWHDVLRRLARKHPLKTIEKMFGRKLGFAARSYILSIRDELGE